MSLILVITIDKISFNIKGFRSIQYIGRKIILNGNRAYETAEVSKFRLISKFFGEPKIVVIHNNTSGRSYEILCSNLPKKIRPKANI